MKLVHSLLIWVALLPGTAGVWGDSTPSDSRPPAASTSPHRVRGVPCLTAGHSTEDPSSWYYHESACEEEESKSKDFAESPSLISELPPLPRVSSQAVLGLWDMAHTAARSATLRC